MPSPKLQSALGLPFPASLPETARADARPEERVLVLFDECGRGLRRYVGSFGLGAAATEDVVQEVFLALFRHLSAGGGDGNLKGWLFRVAHNLALKHRHKTMKRLRAEGSWDAAVVARVADPGAGPEELLAGDRRRQRLGELLRLMSERDRQCVYLRAEGLRYRDIAKTLGVSLGSVAKSLVRAMKQLDAVDLE